MFKKKFDERSWTASLERERFWYAFIFDTIKILLFLLLPFSEGVFLHSMERDGGGISAFSIGDGVVFCVKLLFFMLNTDGTQRQLYLATKKRS